MKSLLSFPRFVLIVLLPLLASTYAVALLNRTAAPVDITVTWAMLGLTSGSASVRDLWAKQDLGTMATKYTATAVPSHGVVMLKVVGQ
ncbi:MAG: hypothetical protein ABUL77_00885 [Bacteroidota bacterium]